MPRITSVKQRQLVSTSPDNTKERTEARFGPAPSVSIEISGVADSINRITGFDTFANNYAVCAVGDGSYVIGGSFSNWLGDTGLQKITKITSQGVPDATWPTGTVNTFPLSIVPADNGGFIVAGLLTSVQGQTIGHICRLNSDGTFDTGWNSGGTGVNQDRIYDVVALDNGQYLVGAGGNSYNGTQVGAGVLGSIFRINADGSLDTSFNGGNRTIGAGYVQNMAVDALGRFCVVGGFSSYATPTIVTRRRCLRLNSDGTLDTTFDPGTSTGGTSDFIETVEVQRDLKWLIGGNFTTYTGTNTPFMARLTTTGALDADFTTNLGTGPSARVRKILVQPDDKILVSGDFTSFNGTAAYYLCRLNPDGTLDTTFTPPILNSTVWDMIIDRVGQEDIIVLSGSFRSSYNKLLRLNMDGTPYLGQVKEGSSYNITVTTDNIRDLSDLSWQLLPAEDQLLRTLKNPNAQGTAVEDRFGYQTIIQDDYAIISSIDEDSATNTGTGVVYVFSVSTGSLLYTVEDPNPNSSDNNQFGFSIAATADKFVVGAPGTASTASTADSGYAYVFDITDGTLLRTIASSSTAVSRYGQSVSINDTYIAIGAPFHPNGVNTNVGRVQIFDTTTYGLISNLFGAVTNQNNQYYGTNVVLDGNILYVQETVSGGSFGTVFARNLAASNSIVWTISGQLIGSGAYNLFGTNIAYNNRYVAISSQYDDIFDINENVGRIWIFDKTTGTEVYEIANPNPDGNGAGDNFFSMTLTDQYLIAGAQGEGSGSGKVYFYDLATGSLVRTLDNPNDYSDTTNDNFGFRLRASTDYLIVSARGEDTATATDSGVVYVFRPSKYAAEADFAATSGEVTIEAPESDQTWTDPGVYNWTVPEGVNSISVVLIGGGGAGNGGTAGGDSILTRSGTELLRAGGGAAGAAAFTGQSAGGGGTAISGTIGGGNGGAGSGGGDNSNQAGGAGGAGGYSGNGGAGGNVFSAGGAGSGGGGAGGGGGSALGDAGGGVGLYGEGANGTCLGSSTPGGGGSGGTAGLSVAPFTGGNYGGGGAVARTGGTNGGAGGGLRYRNSIDVIPGQVFEITVGAGGSAGGRGYAGGGGAARIIWPGNTRLFPSTNLGRLPGFGEITLTATADFASEGPETFRVAVKKTTGTQLAVSGNISINDTSLTP